MGIGIGAHAADGLVKRDVNLLLEDNRLSVQSYGIALGINLGTQDAARFAIDRNLAGFDEFLAAPPRGYARFRKVLLQTDEHDEVADYSDLVLGRPNTRSPSF